MPSYKQFSRIDTMELKSQLFKKLGRQKAEKYFYNLKRLLHLKLSKLQFDKLCYSTIGKENVAIHNMFIRSILGNACLALGPPSKETVTGNSRTSKLSSFRDTFPTSPQRGRSISTRDHRFSDRPKPLGPYAKMPPRHVQEVTNSCDLQRSHEQQSARELISIGSKALLEVASVEDGEEVEQARASPSVQSRSPVRSPLGIPKTAGALPRKTFSSGFAAGFHLSNSYVPESCHSSSELTDTRSLRKQLEHKLKVEGFGLSVDCTNLLNNGLDAFLKRLIKPCMDLARARCSNRRISQTNGRIFPGINGMWQEEQVQGSNQRYYVSLLDFWVAMELNPQLLGGDWPVQLEKTCSHLLEE
ncbi:uncharacterized protein LOC103709216 [Phoenix dactylifera]|uniref:Uncharacterized protein LOC103709216 n=1 Tax=Phoenix dactylifera TaxID=42345 RepID=A0A8B7C6A8_PHODC|nr:uncharacterized protein LOC103709216 [Phoenix dactylifera]XP_017698856.1 uncharacterized protein LOC103709216 [Phoenix dactylifera]